ncbi:glutathione S-transferase family protein [Novosphingobium profundi]|uniref:glutathione S-transferase family protein n=1 Tax=Novosphingobium profundi TaxID=1774954 RepID=UPI001CFC78A8|nr:glutathione S-transferase family protein [Novosphingobium profundi]
MKLYHSDHTRSFRALWALEEVGASYELVMMPFPPRATTPSFKDENPMGTVPLFLDGDTRMTESSAICQYLAERHPEAGLAVAPGDARFGDYLNALHYGEATLTFPQAVYLRYSRFEPTERRLPQAAEDYRLFFRSRLRWLDTQLLRGAYVAGDAFTIADISTGYALMLARRIGIDDVLSPAQHDYLERLAQREGCQRALARQVGQ